MKITNYAQSMVRRGRQTKKIPPAAMQEGVYFLRLAYCKPAWPVGRLPVD